MAFKLCSGFGAFPNKSLNSQLSSLGAVRVHRHPEYADVMWLPSFAQASVHAPYPNP
jgi:hypothetical protein